MKRGTVHLVGAGPGDVGLLTLRGAELLRLADVILHDRLVNEEQLAHASPTAIIIDAGKGHDGHGMSQDEINALLVEHARLGRRVVRLKGGDPFVFGRGSEESDVCRAAGIECEVVPGITSAIAGPAAAGIPVTERGVARNFAVVTARSAAGTGDYLPDLASLAKLDTLVVLMGCKELAGLAAQLVAAGKDPVTPAALVERATWPEQRTTRGTLATIAEAGERVGVRAPVLLIVGPTAASGVGSGGALAGRRIVVTRPRTASVDLVRRLRFLGAEVIEVPLIRMEPIDAMTTREQLAVDWIIFTSLHGVRGFFRSLTGAGLDARAIGNARLAAVGEKTASELWSVGRVRADLVPEEHRAAALVRSLAPHVGAGSRVLFPCGSLAREELPSGLRAAGAIVEEFEVYRTIPTPPSDRAIAELERGVDAALLYSPSGVKALAGHAAALRHAKLICVGPTTAAAVTELKLGDPLVPVVYGDDGVIELTLSQLAGADRSS